MPPASRRPKHESPALLLARVAPQVGRWVERSLGDHEPSLTTAQYLALERLDRGDAGATELATGAGVSRSAVSQLVASLDDLGLVDRLEAGDRRQQILGLNGDGVRVLRSARRLLRSRLGPLLEGLPRHESDRLASSLGQLEHLLSGRPPPRRPPPPKPPGPPRRR